MTLLALPPAQTPLWNICYARCFLRCGDRRTNVHTR